jgi:hypothetical protein
VCRKITSAYTSANLDIPASAFHLTSGELKRVRTTHKDDGFEFSILFCPDCGSSIYAEPHIEGWKDVVIIQVSELWLHGFVPQLIDHRRRALWTIRSRSWRRGRPRS